MATCSRCGCDTGLALAHRRDAQCRDALKEALGRALSQIKKQTDTVNTLSANVIELEAKLKKGARK